MTHEAACGIHQLTLKRQPRKMVNQFVSNTQSVRQNTQSVRQQQPTNYLSVFDHFVGLALKGLKPITEVF